jgi:hypothetical protein
MNDEAWEMHVQESAQQFDYPPTPDIARSVQRRLERRRSTALPWLIGVGAAVLVILLVIVLFVPDLRAQALDWLGIGAVQIVKEESSIDPTTLPTGFDPAYLTTLEAAQAEVDFPLPTLPDLPAFVYLYPGDSVILVWDDFSLYVIESSQHMIKFYAEEETSTVVNGSSALWFTEPHVMEGPEHVERVIEANVLLWAVDGLTYRIETHLPLSEARQIAESMDELGTDN